MAANETERDELEEYAATVFWSVFNDYGAHLLNTENATTKYKDWEEMAIKYGPKDETEECEVKGSGENYSAVRKVWNALPDFQKWYMEHTHEDERLDIIFEKGTSLLSSSTSKEDPITLEESVRAMDRLYKTSKTSLHPQEEPQVRAAESRSFLASQKSFVSKKFSDLVGVFSSDSDSDEESDKAEAQPRGFFGFSLFGGDNESDAKPSDKPDPGHLADVSKGSVQNLRLEAPIHLRREQPQKSDFGDWEQKGLVSEQEEKALNLPRRVHIKTKTESIGWEFYAALRNGRVYVKAKTDDGEDKGPWVRLMGDGLPRRPSRPGNTQDRFEFILKRFNLGWKKADSILSISSDGDNLIMADNNGLVHYVKYTDWIWQGRWGLNLPKIMDTGPAAWLYMMENKNYAISHRHKFNEYYEDYFGKHTQEVGVTSLYLLDYNGTQLLFADPWLHPKWNRPLEGPKRDTVLMAGLDASCSTMFVAGNDGLYYSRFCDYDTLGNNIWFEYNKWYKYDKSFLQRIKAEGKYEEFNQWRLLPGPEWETHDVRTKFPDAVLTGQVTIFANGVGTEARELRIVGKLNGATGYFHKNIAKPDTDWEFQAPSNEITAKIVADLFATATVVPTDPKALPHYRPMQSLRFSQGSIDKVSKENNLVDVYVNGFHEVATPCEITLTFKDAKHHHKTVTAVLHTRRMIPDEATREKEYWGTLIFPEECLDESHVAYKFLKRNCDNEFPRAIHADVTFKDNGEEAHHLQLFKSEGLRVLRTPFKVEMTEVLGSIQQRAKENNPNLSLK